MFAREKFGESQTPGFARIAGSPHTTVKAAVLVEPARLQDQDEGGALNQ